MERSQKERVLAGELHMANNSELASDHLRAHDLLARFNATQATKEAERRELLKQLLGSFGEGAVLRPTLRCDYGYNISIGAHTFVNYDCVLLDCNTIGQEDQTAPGAHIYTATHPLDAATHQSGAEYALPVRIANGAWIGGGSIICPGVIIGENTVVGASSVVAKDPSPDVLAAGHPARMIRTY
ncbi:sugar O-acetyltransferase [Microvirga pakistanensis]|uniref:sugar O-acetyltransferase n=1 Tax=Microvirga pakistanensis TaxID=1682650 RepID=UPI00106CAEF0|nr:sugar O-acetyltransferase [Microvirga pakistanensis]